MKLIGTYQIEDLTIIDPVIEVGQVVDDLKSRNIKNIEILFKMENLQCSRNIDGFVYGETWTDEQVENHVLTILENKLKTIL